MNEAWKANTTAVKTRGKKDLDAQAIVGLHISSKVAKKIARCHFAYWTLQKLEKHCGKNSDHTIEGLQNAFSAINIMQACLLLKIAWKFNNVLKIQLQKVKQ